MFNRKAFEDWLINYKEGPVCTTEDTPFAQWMVTFIKEDVYMTYNYYKINNKRRRLPPWMVNFIYELEREDDIKELTALECLEILEKC